MKQSKRVGPNLFDITDQFHGKQFLHRLGVGGGDGFKMIQGHHIYCVHYFYHYYIMIYNEIIIQLTTMQNHKALDSSKERTT